MSFDRQRPDWQGVYDEGELDSSFEALHGVLIWSG